MKLYWQYEQLDSNLKPKKKSRKIRARSFVKAFLTLLYVKSTATSYSATDYLNASATEEATSYIHFHALGMPGICNSQVCYAYTTRWDNTTFQGYLCGIVVGTGTNAVTSSDYALQTQILPGSTTGKLEYGTTGFTAVAVAAPNASYTIERIFRNSSGGTITINELGIYVVAHQNIYCIARDMISSSPIVMTNGDIVKLTYTFTITA